MYIFFLFAGFSLQGQNIAIEQVQEDLKQLKEAIQKYNPALQTYNPEFEKNVDSLLTQVSGDSLSLVNHFKTVSQLCALSNEGHFALGNWSDDVHSGFLENTYKYLPLTVNVPDEKMFVWIDNSMEQKLNRGDEILSINNMKVKLILSEIYKAIPSDGQITTYVDRNIDLGFSWMYYFYISQPDSFNLTIKDTSGNFKHISIEALTRDVQFKNYAKLYPDRANNINTEEDVFFELNYDGNTAYLTLPSFDYQKVEDNNIKSQKFYKTIFSELKSKQIKHLVIDLRGNTGGRNELADDMVSFFLKKTRQDPFLKKTISWEGKERMYKFPKPSKLAFNGKIYVLVDGRTYSAGNTLCRYLKEYADAVIIGEETGTRYEGFAAGSKQYVTLTNSKLRIGIPRYHILFPKSGKQTTSNRGTLPDFTIRYTMDDIIQQNDLHMEKVNALIKTR